MRFLFQTRKKRVLTNKYGTKLAISTPLRGYIFSRKKNKNKGFSNVVLQQNPINKLKSLYI